MFTIHVCVIVKVSEDKFRRLRRTTTLSFVPRVGDFLCDESWGMTFDHEGAEVESVGISLDDGDVFVWIEDDLTTWKDIDSVPWKDADDMVDECYHGFSEWCPEDPVRRRGDPEAESAAEYAELLNENMSGTSDYEDCESFTTEEVLRLERQANDKPPA